MFKFTGLKTSYEETPKDYVPSQDEWIEHTFTVPASKLRGNNFRLIIQSENRFGNTIYIDDLKYWQNEPSSVSVENYNMSVYPNPFYDNLILDVDGMDGKFTVEAYDMMGRMLFSESFSEQHIELGNAFANEVNGVYFLKVYDGNECKTIKVVKER